MADDKVSLTIIDSYPNDVGEGVVRMESTIMQTLGLKEGDKIELEGQRNVKAICLTVSEQGYEKGVIRIDPFLRKRLGREIGQQIVVKNIQQSLIENKIERKETKQIVQTRKNDPREYVYITISGSCIDFDKERIKIVNFLEILEKGARTTQQWKCHADGEKALGWDFFHIVLTQYLAEKLKELYPDIEKQEGNTFEQRLVLWLDKQFKKKKMDLFLKLSDVPFEKVKGFRLDPKHYREDGSLADLR